MSVRQGGHENRERPPRLPFSATRVLRASRALSSGAKLVWLELFALDTTPAGAFVSASALARRLGMSADRVEQARRELLAQGLLVMLRTARRTGSWFPTMPSDCVPAVVRPSDAEVGVLGGLLDRTIEARMAYSATPIGKGTGVADAAPRPSNAVARYASNGVAGYASPSSNGAAGYAPEVSSLEVGFEKPLPPPEAGRSFHEAVEGGRQRAARSVRGTGPQPLADLVPHPPGSTHADGFRLLRQSVGLPVEPIAPTVTDRGTPDSERVVLIARRDPMLDPPELAAVAALWDGCTAKAIRQAHPRAERFVTCFSRSVDRSLPREEAVA